MGCGQGKAAGDDVAENRNEDGRNNDGGNNDRENNNNNNNPAGNNNNRNNRDNNNNNRRVKNEEEKEEELPPLPPIPLEGYWAAGAVEPGVHPHCTPIRSPYCASEKIPVDEARAKRVVFAHYVQPDALILVGSTSHPSNTGLDADANEISPSSSTLPAFRPAPLTGTPPPAPSSSNGGAGTTSSSRGGGSSSSRGVGGGARKMDIPRIIRRPVRTASEREADDGMMNPPSGDAPLNLNGLRIGADRATIVLEGRNDNKSSGAVTTTTGGEATAATEQQEEPPLLSLNTSWLVGRAFLAQSLVGNSVGWVKVEVPEGKSVYSVQEDGPVRSIDDDEKKKNQEEKEAEGADDDDEEEENKEDNQGAATTNTSSSSSRPGLRKYTLYPDRVEDVGVMLSIGGIARASNTYFGSKEDGKPIPGAFFTYRLGGEAPSDNNNKSSANTNATTNEKQRQREESEALLAAHRKRLNLLQLETSVSLPLFPPLDMLSIVEGGGGDTASRPTSGASNASAGGGSGSDGEGAGSGRLGAGAGGRRTQTSSPHAYTLSEKKCWLTFRQAFVKELIAYLSANKEQSTLWPLSKSNKPVISDEQGSDAATAAAAADHLENNNNNDSQQLNGIAIKHHVEISLALKFRYSNRRFRMGTGLAAAASGAAQGGGAGGGQQQIVPHSQLLECSSGLYFEDTFREPSCVSNEVARGSCTLSFEVLKKGGGSPLHAEIEEEADHADKKSDEDPFFGVGAAMVEDAAIGGIGRSANTEASRYFEKTVTDWLEAELKLSGLWLSNSEK